MLYGNGINNEFFPFCVKKITLAFNLLYFIFLPIYSPWAFRTFFLLLFSIEHYWYKKKTFYVQIRQIFNYFEMKYFLNRFIFGQKKNFLRTVLKIDKISFPRVKTWKRSIHPSKGKKKKYEYLKLLFKWKWN